MPGRLWPSSKTSQGAGGRAGSTSCLSAPAYRQKPSAAKKFILLSLQLAAVWFVAARVVTSKLWTLGWDRNAISLILTHSATVKNFWKRLGRWECSQSSEQWGAGTGCSLPHFLTDLALTVVQGAASSPTSAQFFQSLSQREGWAVILMS